MYFYRIILSDYKSQMLVQVFLKVVYYFIIDIGLYIFDSLDQVCKSQNMFKTCNRYICIMVLLKYNLNSQDVHSRWHI